jgi:hypothetical protein
VATRKIDISWVVPLLLFSHGKDKREKTRSLVANLE